MRIFGKMKDGNHSLVEVDLVWTKILSVDGKLYLTLFFPDPKDRVGRGMSRPKCWPCYILSEECFDNEVERTHDGMEFFVRASFINGYMLLDFDKAEKEDSAKSVPMSIMDFNEDDELKKIISYAFGLNKEDNDDE